MKENKPELPIRSKIKIAQTIEEVLHALEKGDRASLSKLLDNMKANAFYLDADIQSDLLKFSENAEFQLAYDPAHPVTEEVIRAADRLIEDLGFLPPPKRCPPNQ